METAPTHNRRGFLWELLRIWVLWRMAGIALLLDLLKKNPSVSGQAFHSYGMFSATIAASAAAASVAAGRPFPSRFLFGCVDWIPFYFPFFWGCLVSWLFLCEFVSIGCYVENLLDWWIGWILGFVPNLSAGLIITTVWWIWVMF